MGSPFSKAQKELIHRAREFAKPFRIEDGAKFRLKDVDPADTLHLGKDGTIKHVMSGVSPRDAR